MSSGDGKWTDRLPRRAPAVDARAASSGAQGIDFRLESDTGGQRRGHTIAAEAIADVEASIYQVATTYLECDRFIVYSAQDGREGRDLVLNERQAPRC